MLIFIKIITRDTIIGDFDFTDGINLEFFNNGNYTFSITSNTISDIVGHGISASNIMSV
jgi:trimeric autotransporter adhesin